MPDRWSPGIYLATVGRMSVTQEKRNQRTLMTLLIVSRRSWKHHWTASRLFNLDQHAKVCHFPDK
jgi:hypothetical protein